MYQSRYPVKTSHPRQRRMYDSARRELSWPHMTNDVCRRVGSCRACAQNLEDPKLKRQPRLFRESGQLEFIAIDFIGPLYRTADGNQYVNVMTDRYFKLIRASPASKTSSAHVAIVFHYSWIFPYSKLAYVQTDNEVRTTSKVLATFCTTLGVKQLATTA